MVGFVVDDEREIVRIWVMMMRGRKVEVSRIFQLRMMRVPSLWRLQALVNSIEDVIVGVAAATLLRRHC